MKLLKRFGAIILALALAAGATACGGKSMEDKLTGSWYLNGETTRDRDGGSGPAFILYNDGTCKIASEYGTGTWSVVNDDQLKLTNLYGESFTATIESVENGRLTLDQGVYWNTLK